MRVLQPQERGEHSVILGGFSALVLARLNEPNHGYAVVQSIRKLYPDRGRLGNPYETFRRLARRGLITEVRRRALRKAAGNRARLYQITPFGRVELERFRLAINESPW